MGESLKVLPINRVFLERCHSPVTRSSAESGSKEFLARYPLPTKGCDLIRIPRLKEKGCQPRMLQE